MIGTFCGREKMVEKRPVPAAVGLLFLKLVHSRDGFIFRGMKGLRILLILIAFINGGQNSLCQDSSSRFSVVLSPVLFMPVSVALQSGIQYEINNRFALLTEAALPLFHPNSTDYEEIKYWRAGIELKYYGGKLRHSGGRYFSFQTNYLYRKLVDNDEGVVHRKNGEFIYEGANIKSPVLSTAVKAGIQLPAGKNFFIDAFFGLGARFIINQYSSKKFRLISTAVPKNNFVFIPEEAWRYDYTLTRLHLAAGLRLGMKL